MQKTFWGGDMRQTLLIAVALGLSVTGCDFISGLTGGGSTTTTNSPSVSTVPVPVPAPSGSPTAGTPSPSPFGQPTVAQKDTPKGILPPDLISSTDPNQRVQQVKGNRNDPFALLPTTPSIELPPGATPSGGVPPSGISPGAVSPGSVPGAAPSYRPGASGNRPSANKPSKPTTASGSPNRASSPNRSTAQGGSGSPGSGQASPTSKPAPRSPIASPVPRPDPVLAKAVEVTGVVQIGNQAYAIVNAPNEPTSRYVQEGQRLAGGQVLVRRIDFNRASPVVILEQSGVEVVRAVGESAAIASPAAGTPTI